jgi:peptidase M28-like protein
MRSSLIGLSLLPAAALAGCGGGVSSSPAPFRATGTEITATDLQHRLFAFAHDSMAGRQTGQAGNYKAADYVAAEFRRLGLQPAGEGAGFFQVVPFYRVRPEPGAQIEVDGTALVAGRDFLPVNDAAAGRPTDGAMAIAGGALDDASTWPAPDAVTGKVVVFSLGADPRRSFTQFIQARQSPRFESAALLALPALELLGTDMIAAQTSTGALLHDSTTTRALAPGVFVSKRAAELLLGSGTESIAPGTLGRTVRGTIRRRAIPVDIPARNVVAILPGSDPALRDTYVSITAHNDHVGFDRAPVDHDSIRALQKVTRPMGADSRPRQPLASEWPAIRKTLDSLRALRPPRQDSIYNGADDDGSGSVALLEIAERFATGPRPRRSILFVSHAAEERGLLGSRWYTDHPTVSRDSIVAEIDLDMVGRGGKTDLPEGGTGYMERVGARRLSTELGDILDRVNARQSTPFEFNDTYDAPGHPLQYYCRADHYSYARYGIPSVSLSRGEHVDYHQVTDEPQYIDYAGLERVARLVYDVAQEIGNLDHRPALDKPKGDPRAPCRQ